MFEGQSIRLSTLPGDIAELCFDRQGESINKLDRRTLDELAECAKLLAGNDSLKGLVVTSGKGVFIVGADIMEFGATFAQPEEQISAWGLQANAIFSAIEDLPFPSVTAINGICLGGGTEMSLSTDYRVIAQGAQMGLPEVKLGIMPGCTGTQNLPLAIGERRAKELILTGEPFTAQQAFEWGLVNKVVPYSDLIDEALITARKIAANAPLSTMRAKRAISVANQVDRTTGFQFELEGYNQLIGTEDRMEGVRAFNEKRSPVFKGK